MEHYYQVCCFCGLVHDDPMWQQCCNSYYDPEAHLWLVQFQNGYYSLTKEEFAQLEARGWNTEALEVRLTLSESLYRLGRL